MSEAEPLRTARSGTTTYELTPTHVRIRTANWWTKHTETIPLDRIDAIRTTHRRHVLALLVAVLCLTSAILFNTLIENHWAALASLALGAAAMLLPGYAAVELTTIGRRRPTLMPFRTRHSADPEAWADAVTEMRARCSRSADDAE